MSASVINDMRKEVKRYIDIADDKTVKMVYAMLEVEQKEDEWSDEVFLAEMDRRTKEYEAGTARVFTLQEMEYNAKDAYKQTGK